MTDQSGNAGAGAKQPRTDDKATAVTRQRGADEPEATAAASEPAAVSDPTTPPETAAGTQHPNSDAESAENTGDGDESRASAEEFAREHDPAKHDIAAGEQLRQRGDWTADEADSRVWDAEGNLVVDTSPPEPAHGQGESADATGEGDQGGDVRRTSSLDEVRDGGYSVGSAAPIEDGSMPLGHPVKAWEDTKTFMTPEDSGYDDGEPHVWFTDTGAARRAGFGPAD
ncbi:MAG: hypothetical protein M3Y71_13935 [Actinomycetota bacterium]|nr:hypothetical protein [Actinomycetota bacterium]